MGRRRRKSKYNELIDSLYSIVFIGSIFIWIKTSSIYLGIVSFIVFWIIFYASIAYVKKKKKQKLISSGIDLIDKMDGVEFEKFLLEHFKQQGYVGRLTPATADYGADLVLQKDKRKVVIQAKRWNRVVGIEAVQQIIGAIKHYDADKGMVITNSTFTENAYNLAETNGIELWDRKSLIKFFSGYKSREIVKDISTSNSDVELAATAEETCPLCSKSLVFRNGKNGKFWGCSGFPKCKFTKGY